MRTRDVISHFSEDDHETWRRFFAEARKSWSTHSSIIHPYYRENTFRLEQFSEHIPTISELNVALAPIGWSSRYVNGLVPGWEIAAMLHQKIMPVSQKIRPPSELHFAREPDIIHDIFGHFPALFSDDYRALLKEWSEPSSSLPVYEGDRASYHLNKMMVLSHGHVSEICQMQLMQSSQRLSEFLESNPTPSQCFDKAYFWIFEFGIIQQADQILILGAGILSSLNELDRLAVDDCVTEELSQENILESYNISSHQDQYLVAPHIDHYRTIIRDIARSSTALLKEVSYAQQ